MTRNAPGLYVSLSSTSPATFFLRYTDPNMHERRMVRLGVYHAELFNVVHARTEAMHLKARIGRGEDVAQAKRQAKAQQAKLSGVTVDQIIDERIAWMSTLVRKADGEMRPRIESWANVASHLDRFVSPRLGKRIASEVTKHDIALLSNDIVAGKLGAPSVANARDVRRALSAMFTWAAVAGRDYATASPCINLPPLDEENARTLVLSEDEIRTLWHGLDRAYWSWDRKTRLAIKFALVGQHAALDRAAAHAPRRAEPRRRRAGRRHPGQAGEEAARSASRSATWRCRSSRSPSATTTMSSRAGSTTSRWRAT